MFRIFGFAFQAIVHVHQTKNCTEKANQSRRPIKHKLVFLIVFHTRCCKGSTTDRVHFHKSFSLRASAEATWGIEGLEAWCGIARWHFENDLKRNHNGTMFDFITCLHLPPIPEICSFAPALCPLCSTSARRGGVDGAVGVGGD